MKSQSKYQLSVQKELIKISGRPQKIHDLNNLGKNIRVWVWKLSRKRDRNALLALADKAKDLDCEVYFLKYKRKNQSWSGRITISPELINETEEIAVWCENK